MCKLNRVSGAGRPVPGRPVPGRPVPGRAARRALPFRRRNALPGVGATRSPSPHYCRTTSTSLSSRARPASSRSIAAQWPSLISRPIALESRSLRTTNSL